MNDELPDVPTPATTEPNTQIKALLKRITELENELKDSQRRTQIVLANVPMGVLLLHRDGRIDAANKVIERMFGYSRGDIAEKRFDFLLPKLEKLEPNLATTETLARNADNNFFPVEISTMELSTPDGSRIFAFVSDITERHKIEQMKREFVAMISHDVRSPLMNISGIIELMRHGKFGDITPASDEQLQVADRNLVRVIQMISELLEIERIEAGNIPLIAKLNNLTTTAREAIAAVEQLAEAKSIAIKCWDNNLIAVFDGDRLHRVFVNLLANAIKFSPEHSFIALEQKKVGKEFEICVIDHGRGVPESSRDIIFSKFSQVSVKDDTESGGTGLGLAVCKGIVEAHGGTIGVRANDDGSGGSTFWFRLPIGEE
jgi:PAS domain S-box